jgi:hypothetical protein
MECPTAQFSSCHLQQHSQYQWELFTYFIVHKHLHVSLWDWYISHSLWTESQSHVTAASPTQLLLVSLSLIPIPILLILYRYNSHSWPIDAGTNVPYNWYRYLYHAVSLACYWYPVSVPLTCNSISPTHSYHVDTWPTHLVSILIKHSVPVPLTIGTSTKATSFDWQIPVFSYGLLMSHRGYIDFEMLETQCWSYLRNIKTSINSFFYVAHIIYPYFT